MSATQERNGVLDAVLSRRSATRLIDPAPAAEELLAFIQAAATAPDHGRLRPWRLIVVQGEQRRVLGEAFRESVTDPQRADSAATKPLRAPLLLSIVFRPQPDHPKVPEWEQLAAVVAMVQTLLLLLHAHGWGAIWRTGTMTEAAPVLKCLDLCADERLLGWLYIGTVAPTDRQHSRDMADVESRVTWHQGASETYGPAMRKSKVHSQKSTIA